MFGEGVQHDHVELEGRAFDGEFSGKSRLCSKARFGTMIASLAAGSTVGVAKKANVYRYIVVAATKIPVIFYTCQFSLVLMFWDAFSSLLFRKSSKEFSML